MLAVLNLIGSVMYGLAQFAETRWLLVAGSATRGLIWGATGSTLAQDSLEKCAGKRTHSSLTALRGNIQFLGMGSGPLLAAILGKVNFNIEFLQAKVSFNEFTNPGWFFAIAWLLMIVWLLFLHEPQRRFAKTTQPTSVPTNDTAACKIDSRLAWCLLVIFATSADVAAWEASAAFLTQRYFGFMCMH